MSWFDTLQAQPWFSDVAKEFATYAPNVPTSVWEGELLTEDSSLKPGQQDYLSSGHWGLFQENQNFPTTVGLPPATVTQLQDPVYNAYVAALAMQNALKKSGATTLQAQVQALEQAGWPGAVSSSETASRIANIQQIVTAQGGSATSPSQSASGSTSTTPPPWWNPLAGVPEAITSGVNSLEQNLLVGGIVIAMVGGGFLLLSNSMSDGGGSKAPSVVPVPV